MTSMFGGRGTEDGRIARAFAPGEVDGVRRVMTLCGAWLRRLRSPTSRSESSCIGGNRSAARRRRDCSDGPDSHGCASAARPEIASALFGVCRLNRAVVPTLVGLTLLAGVATQAYAQTVPTVSFATGSHTAFEGSGTHNVALTLNPAPTSDITVKYRIQNKATSLYPYATLGSDFTIATPGTVTVPKGATTATIPVTIIDDTEGEWEERIYLWLMEGTGYRFNPWHWRVGPSAHTLTIAANDTPPPLVSIPKKSQTLGEGSGTHNVNLTLNPAPTSDITVKYELSPPPSRAGRQDDPRFGL